MKLPTAIRRRGRMAALLALTVGLVIGVTTPAAAASVHAGLPVLRGNDTIIGHIGWENGDGKIDRACAQLWRGTPTPRGFIWVPVSKHCTNIPPPSSGTSRGSFNSGSVDCFPAMYQTRALAWRGDRLVTRHSSEVLATTC